MYHAGSEPVQFERDCEAIMVPSGDPVTLPLGTVGYITQSLGGSFTIFVEGNLFRLAGVDADAIGKEIQPGPQLPDDHSEDDFRDLVWAQLKTCYDPEIPVNIVDLGLIYDVDYTRQDDGSRHVSINMTLTAPGCGMGDILVEDVRSKVDMIPTVSAVAVNMLFDPPWNQSMMSDSARLELGFF